VRPDTCRAATDRANAGRADVSVIAKLGRGTKLAAPLLPSTFLTPLSRPDEPGYAQDRAKGIRNHLCVVDFAWIAGAVVGLDQNESGPKCTVPVVGNDRRERAPRLDRADDIEDFQATDEFAIRSQQAGQGNLLDVELDVADWRA